MIEPREIASARGKLTLFAIGCWCVALGGHAIADDFRGPEWRTNLGLAAFYGLAALFTVNACRPARFKMDRHGFYIPTTLFRKNNPHKVRWQDVERFSVQALPRERFKRVIAHCRPGFPCPGGLPLATNHKLDGDNLRWIPIWWPRPAETIAAELNEYRRRALTETGHDSI